MNPADTHLQRTFTALTVFAVLAGIYFRFSDLGFAPLSVDEYYLTLSVLSVLENGLPTFDCGGYYMRGLLQQYASAIMVFFADSTEYAMRIYPLMSNLLCMAGVFLIAKRASNHIGACIATMLFALSLWEIEFARFARMYSPFQALLVWQVWLCIRAVVDGKQDYIKWMLLLSAISILTYEGAIFAIAINVIPLVHYRSKVGWAYFAVYVLILVSGVIFQVTDFRHLGVTTPWWPEGVQRQSFGSGPIAIPEMIFASKAISSGPTLIVLLFPLAITLYTIYAILRTKGLPLFSLITLILASVLPAAQLVGFSIMLLATGFLVGVLSYEQLARKEQKILITVLANIVMWGGLWFIAGLIGNSNPEASLVRVIRDSLVSMLKYPNFLDNFVYIWLDNIPVTTLLLASAIGVGSVYAVKARLSQQNPWLLVLGCVGLLCLLLGLLNLPYKTTRYSFFLFPFLLILASSAIALVANAVTSKTRTGAIAILLLPFAYLIVSEDHHLDHLFNMNSESFVYRTAYPKEFREHYKERKDVLHAAHYVNERYKEGDIVVAEVSTVDFYLEPQLDYRFKSYELREFANHTACGGTKDIWTNANLLYTEQQLIETALSHQSGNTWILIQHNRVPEILEQYLETTSVDGFTKVLRVPNQSINKDN